MQPMVADDVAAFVVVSVSAPEPPLRVTSPVNVAVLVTASVLRSTVAPEAVKALLTVDDAVETNPPNVERPVALNVPSVAMFAFRVVAASTNATTNNVPTMTAATIISPCFAYCNDPIDFYY